MSNKEITITNANNQYNFICFKLKGLEDNISSYMEKWMD